MAESWLDGIDGYKEVQSAEDDGDVTLPRRPRVRFLGALVEDDPTNNRTNVTVGGGGSGTPGESITPSNSVPVGVTPSVGTPGTSDNYSRADHRHQVATAAPVAVGDTLSTGSADAVARADHVHTVTLAGDITGARASTWVAKLQSILLLIGAPTDGQLLTYEAASSTIKFKNPPIMGGGPVDTVHPYYDVVQHGEVVLGPLANNTLRQQNTSRFNDAIVAAKAAGKTLWVPPGRYELYGTVVLNQPRLRWFGDQDAQLIQYNLNVPVLHIGPPNGTPGATLEGVVVDGAQLRYSAPAGTAGRALEMSSLYKCRVGNLEIGDVNQGASGATSVPWMGVWCDQATGTTPCFSNTFHDIRIKNFAKYGWSQFRDDYAAATGNLYSNIYISAGGGGDIRDISGNDGIPLYIGAMAQGVWLQLNIEWSACKTAAHFEVCRDTVIDSFNIEGITLKNPSSARTGLISWYNGDATIAGLTVNDCTYSSSNNVSVPSIFRLGSDTSISVDAMRPMLCTKSGITDYAVVRNWDSGGNTGIRFNLGHIVLGDGDQLDLVDAVTLTDGGAAFSGLSDFVNRTPRTLSDANYTHYTYGGCGVLFMAPSTARTLKLTRQFAAAIACRIPSGVPITIRKTSGAGSIAITNYNDAAITTLTDNTSADLTFNGTDWVIVSLSGDGSGGGGGGTPGGAPVNVTKATAAAGASTDYSRADHKHDVSTAAPTGIGDAAAEGSASSLARSDHIHPLTLAGDITGNRGTTNVAKLQGKTLTIAASPTDGHVLTWDSTTSSILFEAPSGGGATPGGAPVNVTKATAAAGVATTYSRSDHKHDVTTAAPSSVGTSNAEGSSSSLARADHVHAVSMTGDMSTASGLAATRVYGLYGIPIVSTPGGTGQALTYNATTNQYEWRAPGGDLGNNADGTAAQGLGAAVVKKLQNVTLTVGSPSDGQVLTYDSTTTSIRFESITLPSLAGDVIGAAATNTVNRLQNKVLVVGTPTDGMVLTYDSATDQIRFEDNSLQDIVTIAGSSLTITTAHYGKLLLFSNSGGCTVTLPVALAPGTTKNAQINCIQSAAGQVTFQGDGSSAVAPPSGLQAKTRAVFSEVTLRVINSGSGAIGFLSGDLALVGGS